MIPSARLDGSRSDHQRRHIQSLPMPQLRRLSRSHDRRSAAPRTRVRRDQRRRPAQHRPAVRGPHRPAPVMEDHIHLIASSPDLSRNVRSFLSFTARQLIDHLTDSEETAHLRVLEQNRLDSRKSHRYRVWRPGFHPQALLSNSMMDQKISYIHENPVRKGLVQRAEDWPYSSLAFLKGATHLPPVEQAIF